jgi:hypothetical protein
MTICLIVLKEYYHLSFHLIVAIHDRHSNDVFEDSLHIVDLIIAILYCEMINEDLDQ